VTSISEKKKVVEKTEKPEKSEKSAAEKKDSTKSLKVATTTKEPTANAPLKKSASVKKLALSPTTTKSKLGLEDLAELKKLLDAATRPAVKNLLQSIHDRGGEYSTTDLPIISEPIPDGASTVRIPLLVHHEAPLPTTFMVCAEREKNISCVLLICSIES
jgi:hypothetical protein